MLAATIRIRRYLTPLEGETLSREGVRSGIVKRGGESSMQLTVPPDVEALVQKRLATGAFANVEDVIRRALETLDAEESWTDEERSALDEKIDRALEQVAAGRVYGPEGARRKLAALREAHLADPG
jgi:Arc/MetJ-type ribon-helix-helix transcriptional regulator